MITADIVRKKFFAESFGVKDYSLRIEPELMIKAIHGGQLILIEVPSMTTVQHGGIEYGRSGRCRMIIGVSSAPTVTSAHEPSVQR